MQRLIDVKRYKVKIIRYEKKKCYTIFLVSCKVSIHRTAPAAACE